MAGASIETTLELFASSLRDVKARIRIVYAGARCGFGEPFPGRLAG